MSVQIQLRIAVFGAAAVCDVGAVRVQQPKALLGTSDRHAPMSQGGRAPRPTLPCIVPAVLALAVALLHIVGAMTAEQRPPQQQESAAFGGRSAFLDAIRVE